MSESKIISLALDSKDFGGDSDTEEDDDFKKYFKTSNIAGGAAIAGSIFVLSYFLSDKTVKNIRNLACAAAITSVAYCGYNKHLDDEIKSQKKQLHIDWKNAVKRVVIIHGIGGEDIRAIRDRLGSNMVETLINEELRKIEIHSIQRLRIERKTRGNNCSVM